MSKLEVLMFALIFFLSLTTSLSTEKFLKEAMINQKQKSLDLISNQEAIINPKQKLLRLSQ